MNSNFWSFSFLKFFSFFLSIFLFGTSLIFFFKGPLFGILGELFLLFSESFISLLFFICIIFTHEDVLLLLKCILFDVLFVNPEVKFSFELFLISLLIILFGFLNNICAFLLMFSSTKYIFSTF